MSNTEGAWPGRRATAKKTEWWPRGRPLGPGEWSRSEGQEALGCNKSAMRGAGSDYGVWIGESLTRLRANRDRAASDKADVKPRKTSRTEQTPKVGREGERRRSGRKWKCDMWGWRQWSVGERDFGWWTDGVSREEAIGTVVPFDISKRKWFSTVSISQVNVITILSLPAFEVKRTVGTLRFLC
uniref:Uncharacterized protein n=1 Tax=Steinernema glaseri TaxID=37863 RepID=A0A1I7ZWL0_9BILA